MILKGKYIIVLIICELYLLTSYLRCAEPGCNARAWKKAVRDTAPIIPLNDSSGHNHQPDFSIRNQFKFLLRCKIQAASKKASLNDIWLAESARYAILVFKLPNTV